MSPASPVPATVTGAVVVVTAGLETDVIGGAAGLIETAAADEAAPVAPEFGSVCVGVVAIPSNFQRTNGAG